MTSTVRPTKQSPDRCLHYLRSFRQNTHIIKNSECAVHDIGDGVMCLEFQSKSNSIGEGIGKAIAESIDMAENEAGTA